MADRTAADEGERLEEPSPVTPQEVEVDEREATEAEHDPTAETAPLHADEEEDPVVRAEAEGQEYLALAKRTQADFENYRKRAAKDLGAAGERARAALVRELLPVVDNLERALAAATEAEQSLAHGVQLVLGELAGVFSQRHPDRAPWVEVSVVQTAYALVDGVPQGETSRVLATWRGP